MAGKYTVLESTSKSGNRLVSFVQMYDLITVSTKFQHDSIHKGMWAILGTNDVNYTDHVLANRRRRMHTVTDVTGVRGPNCDSDQITVWQEYNAVTK
jgi:hypothetical protein